ncbi:hypothetical protein Tco_0792943 [Tanacetum coccineum]
MSGNVHVRLREKGGGQIGLVVPHSRLQWGLHIAEEIVRDGFEAYCVGSLREIINKGDLSDYWARISSDGDFLGVSPSYTLIRDPLKRLCHRLRSFSISGRAQAPEKVTATDLFYLRSMDEGTKNVPYLRLAEHFGLVSDEGLIGLTVIARKLLLIYMDELVRLRICDRLDDTWAWVAPGPERQQVAAAGAPEGAMGILIVNESRMARLEEEVHGLRESLDEQRKVMDMMARDLSRFTMWATRGISQLLDATRATYTRFKIENELIKRDLGLLELKVGRKWVLSFVLLETTLKGFFSWFLGFTSILGDLLYFLDQLRTPLIVRNEFKRCEIEGADLGSLGGEWSRLASLEAKERNRGAFKLLRWLLG